MLLTLSDLVDQRLVLLKSLSCPSEQLRLDSFLPGLLPEHYILCADIASSGAAAAAPHEATHCGPDWGDCICHELLHAVPKAATSSSHTTQELCRGRINTAAAAKGGAEKGLGQQIHVYT